MDHESQPSEPVVESAPPEPDSDSESIDSLTNRIFSPTGARDPVIDAAVRGREIIALFLMVLLADLTIYRGHGFAGMAAFFVAASVLLRFGAPRPKKSFARWVVASMLVALAVKLLWVGTEPGVAAGYALLVAFALAMSGRVPYVPDVLGFAFQVIYAGGLGLAKYWRWARKPSAPQVSCAGAFRVALPALAVLLFGTLFVLANPDLRESVSAWIERSFRWGWESFLAISPEGTEILFWGVVGWLTVGLLRPVVLYKLMPERAKTTAEPTETIEALGYAAYRNTLVAVGALFAAYLAFEFQTLWFRVFPPGFHYSGYAHEGAAWLTVALALATVILSGIFGAKTMRDRRVAKLRRLAWIWSAENALLAIAVYHRLHIYIGFNGMTRMRTVGLLGITAVVIGFFFVLRKIACRRDFVWLIHRQLWTLACVTFAYLVLPVDALVHRYNVSRIIAGDPAPSVQISVHPIDAGGYLVLLPLLRCDNPIVRDGVAAMLAEQAADSEIAWQRTNAEDWTRFQIAEHLLRDQLRRHKNELAPFADPEKRRAAIEKFDQYAYQWF